MTGLKPLSAAGYRKDFEAFRRFVGASSAEAAVRNFLRLDDGQAATVVLAYQSSMLDRELSPATIARRVAALHRAVRRARMAGLTTLNLETECPKAEAFRDVRGPGAAGWRKMLEHAEADAGTGKALALRNLAILRLLHDRALRRGEVVGLDLPEDLDLSRPAVAVLGKGKRAKEWLTLNDPTRDAIARYLEQRAGLGPGPLFVRFDPAAGSDVGAEFVRLDGESVNRMVQRLAKRVGLPRAVRAHGLRHCAITTALDAGYDVRDVKAFSRHSKIDTVLIYDDRRKDVGGQISQAIGRRRALRKRAGKQPLSGAQ